MAEGYEGANWHVGTLARGKAKIHGCDVVAPLPTNSGDTWARGEAKY